MSSLPLLVLALSAAPAFEDVEPFREPLALADAAGALFAACANGALVRVDAQEVTGVWKVARTLSDVAALDDGRTLALTDPESGEVLLFDTENGSLARPFDVPQASSVAQTGDTLVVGSLWSRTITRVGLATTGGRTDLVHDDTTVPLRLPFSPREMTWSPAIGRLVVGDAFGGWLAVVDVARWRVEATHELAAQNIRGLAVRDGRALVAHQVVDPLAHSSFDDVHWGNLVRNVVREVPLGFAEVSDRPGRARLHQLGDVESGAADPSALLVDAEGRFVTTLAGTGELLVLDPATGEQTRFPAGSRPLDVVGDADGRYAVASSLDGTVSWIDTDSGTTTTVALGGPPPRDLVTRGKELFFDARLSHDSWMSCHTCHSDGHTTGRLADTLGDGSYDSPKRILSLLGAGATAPYAWNGVQPTLEAQIEKTLRTTMHADRIDADDVTALAAYVRSLQPPPATASTSDAAQRGHETFRTSGCTECHEPPTFTTTDTFEVGVTDETGVARFNPPSLRGVAHRDRLFHDGRFVALADVLVTAGHPGTEGLGAREVEDLIAYLRTL